MTMKIVFVAIVMSVISLGIKVSEIGHQYFSKETAFMEMKKQ